MSICCAAPTTPCTPAAPTIPPRRLQQHNAGQGAKYTRSRRPVSLVYLEQAGDHGQALRREAALKRLTPQGETGPDRRRAPSF